MHSMASFAEHEPAAEVARAIGCRVRSARTQHEWTLDELAQRSGVSRRMLVNVEHGTTNPSIATLLRLSEALGIGLPALVDATDSNAHAVQVHRAGERAPIWNGPSGGTAVMVAGTTDPQVGELWDWRLAADERYVSEAHREGTYELLVVLAGSLRLVVGSAEHLLKTGDSASFDGSLPHEYRNASGSRAARFALAVVEPGSPKEAR